MAIRKKPHTFGDTLHRHSDKALVATYILLSLTVLLVAAKIGLQGVRQQMVFDYNTYQAVTLTTGQTFFGRLDPVSSKTFALYDAYYIQKNDGTATEEDAAASDTEAAKTTDDLQLVKVSEDLHMPADPLLIDRSQVVYWQNLEQNSPIIQTINGQ